MAPNSKRQRRVPLGKVKPWTDEELDAMSVPTAADIERAKALWRESVPGSLKTLLDARPMADADDNPT